jgi:hypothetical protein
MTIYLPPKKYYSFAELAARFQCSEQDILHLVIERQITPSFYLDGMHCLEFQINRDEDQDGVHLFPSPLDNWESKTDELQCRTWLTGFHYLVWMQRKGVSECEFLYASKSSESPDEGDIVYEIERQLCLQDVQKNGVVMADELARFESIHDKNVDSSPTNKPLTTRERDTLLTIIAALCEAARISIDPPGKAALFIEGLTDSMGTHVSKRAIENHLKKIPNALETRMK